MITAKMLCIGGQQDLPAGSEAKEPCCTTGHPTMQCYLLVVGIIIIIIIYVSRTKVHKKNNAKKHKKREKKHTKSGIVILNTTLTFNIHDQP